MINYETLEGDIINRLAPFLTVGVSVERIPETESEKEQVLPSEARFTVIYAGSEYDETSSTGNPVQKEKIFVQILIESTFLYGSKGIYNLIPILKQSIVGFRPQNMTPLQLSKHHSISPNDLQKVNNMWQYMVIFQGNSIYVENFTEDLTPLLKKITYIDGSETVVVPPEVV